MDDGSSPGSKTHLTWSSIALALSFIASSVVVAFVFGLRVVGTSMAVAAARCVIQLALLALVLKTVYEANNPWLVAGIACLLNLLGAFETVVNGSTIRHSHMFPAVLLAMLVSTLPISMVATSFIMPVEPFWRPEQYIPIAGMLVGSTISGMVVALTVVLQELQENRDKVETYLAFGASRIEASKSIAQQALYTALTPVVNQMSVTGIISIPGTMTGAILGGSDVEKAAKLQMVIIFCHSASTALGSIIATILCLGVVIDSQHRIRDDRIHSREHVIWRTREKIVNGIIARMSEFWIRLRKREERRSEEHTRVSGT